ncbi:MAG: ROK family protein [Rhizobiaceae bacterium]|nr:ROK family protein [Rhizobiaceae bacterium]MCV0409042.1 ROK family protein [Rhizobiaceae bacterium]
MTVGHRPDDLRRRNRAMAIAAVRKLESASRTEIATATGLSPSTISAISSDLIAEGVLATGTVADAGHARRGRPQVGLVLEPRAASVVTLALRLNALSSALIDYRGQIIRADTIRIPTGEMDGQALIKAAIRAIKQLNAGEETPVMRIAIAVQGTTDAHRRAMLWSPITVATDVDFALALEDEFRMPVTIDNDCNMMAEALRWRDPATYRDDFLAILLSDGIGMGLMMKGKLFTGGHSSGGEFGHMVVRPEGALCRCGRQGCVEAYAGNYAIWRAARGLPETSKPEGDREPEDMLALARAARRGDGPERAAFRAAGEAVGYGLGSLFALIDAAPVAFIGPGAGALDLMEEPMRDAILKTAGGEHSQALSFATFPEELPLIRQGSAMRALTAIDDMFAARGPVRERHRRSA